MCDKYKTDILGNGFEQLTIEQPCDYEGKVVRTLIRKRCKMKTGRAVLYIHGYNDYFFQEEMADRYIANGFDFYALDLRKYGRSLLSNQSFNGVMKLSEYYGDIDKALAQIKSEAHSFVLLSGHSTGGLIISIYMHGRKCDEAIKGVFLNSPFYDFNKSEFTKKRIIPLASYIGGVFPKLRIRGGFSSLYGTSLHRSRRGEWEYNLDWKPLMAKTVSLGFIHATYEAQKVVKKGLSLNVPVLVMHSNKTIYDKKYSKEVARGDVILNVEDIRKNAEKIRGSVSIITIENGMHDLMLSEESVREQVYLKLFKWLERLRNKD